ncbi:hypothetical protein Nos7524_3226 [Nostoc sp. PCC 7524]|uniref:hypothetical protein n=1 Tax=Nostoc sp. (strain ATCC 29411 / PCC 7524) TaxID=28072 RepID=UPI00029EE098|nr:hypothetical protein [Nostoc sp. PCC 7524]AFY49026.1 hypothetical protein Nos7524_3226 [Nostoc sp. PCC 7524]
MRYPLTNGRYADSVILVRESGTPQSDWVATVLNSSSDSYTSLNNSDRVFTVPVNTEWRVNLIYAQLVSSAVAGSRRLICRVESPLLNPICEMVTQIQQAASTTLRYSFAEGLPDVSSVRATSYVTAPFPPVIIGAGCRVRVLDLSAIDSSGDNLTVRLNISQRSI